MLIYSTLSSLFVGIFVGAIFSLLKLPTPAPTDIRGVVGILGVFLGYLFVKLLIK